MKKMSQETYHVSVNAKGQVVIPVALRRKFGIKPSTRIHIEVVEIPPRIILRPITREYVHSLRGKYKGMGLLKTLIAERMRERDR